MSNERPTELPLTEQENPRTRGLSSLPTAEVLRLMNEEDAGVAAAVGRVLGDVERAVEEVVKRLSAGGRLFYVGTGTSGRLGVLDASECPPTFGVPPELVQGIIAGGYDALYRATEVAIVPVVGPEVLAGSTRLKAGTAQKLVLNMISTATMVRLGYVTGNRMTNLQPRNVKLRARSLRILGAEAGF